jgi:hypothetical protein
MVHLAAARMTLLFIPFPRIARYLGVFSPPAAGYQHGQPPNPAPDQIQTASEIGWAVRRVARRMPFRADCLPQAMAAKWMLRRRGVVAVMFIGGAKDANGLLETHAWLLAAGVEVTGYPVAYDFTPVSSCI